MKEHPFLAMDSVARAILTGRQTQDRRPIDFVRRIGRVAEFQVSTSRGFDFIMRDRRGAWNDLGYEELVARLPWQPGDLLYVREAWMPACDEGCCAYYRADYAQGQPPGLWAAARWRPNIHMPKKLTRTWLRVERVWIEQVQDISEEDARAEGCASIAEFRELWDSLYGTWGANPWVRCCEFKVVAHHD